jgi:hypothetical protein
MCDEIYDEPRLCGQNILYRWPACDLAIRRVDNEADPKPSQSPFDSCRSIQGEWTIIHLGGQALRDTFTAQQASRACELRKLE